jgi:hypothetical protein
MKSKQTRNAKTRQVTRLYGQRRRATAAGKTGEIKRNETAIAQIESMLLYGVSRESMARKLKRPMRVIDQHIDRVRKRWEKEVANARQILRLRKLDRSELSWASLTAAELKHIIDNDGRLPPGVSAELLLRK